MDIQRGIDAREDFAGGLNTCGDGFFLRDDASMTALAGIDEILAGEVAGADILGQRDFDWIVHLGLGLG